VDKPALSGKNVAFRNTDPIGLLNLEYINPLAGKLLLLTGYQSRKSVALTR